MVNQLQKLLDNLPSWMAKNAETRNYKFLKSFATELDFLEQDIYDMQAQVFIDTATGTYLEDLGKLYKLYRKDGETDSEFRARILGFWPGFSGGGTVDAIKQSINRITDIPESKISITEQPDLKIEVGVEISESTFQEIIIEIVEQSKAAGIYAKTYFTFVADDELMVADTAETDINLLH